MKPPPILKAIAGYIWTAAFFLALLYMIFWNDIKNSDTYQRNFNATEWHLRQQNNVEHQARSDELNRMECAIMLRAKAALIPVEIERNTLYGMPQDVANKFVMDEFDLDKKLCDEHGISPYVTNGGKDTHDDCERYPGIYGC